MSEHLKRTVANTIAAVGLSWNGYNKRPADLYGAMAERLVDAQLVQSPETAAELERLRKSRDAFRDQRNAVFQTNRRLVAEVEESDQARLRAENETRTVKREADVLRSRVDEVERAYTFDTAELKRQLESERVDGKRLIRAEQRRAELEAVLATHRKDDQAEIERLRAQVAELEAAAFGSAEVRLLSPVEQIRHLHSCVAAQMGRADTLDRLLRKAQAREAAQATPAEDPARCLKVHAFSPRDGWRMVCGSCDHGKGAECHRVESGGA